ncbi:CCA tRNA nucleotidyltransferase [Limimaricola hongkongensis]|uniref:tRNA nucleotidyltransferase n=1 Tax=Limimaricola hongkongensis DSM 17492 TaxID=1122180 RepID=A0A017HFR6_9RHOB|nr:CCA tRNA nucleotidyltransferase [Limimaricola hongkongensis]EYD73206.1 tRNA nucleotidyltransferase [Limimaricola hongkongensis DSM 17492]
MSERIEAEWLEAAPARAVTGMLEAAGFQAWFVGGCVRNALLGAPVSDLDLTTDARPERVVELARDAGLKPVPTGIDHGTVTVVAHGTPIEVTTFRRDVDTDGRRATVAFSDDIAEDAARRDFTMNALYADARGHVADPLGVGQADLAARRLSFIGDPHERIREDYLRILRFFRFHAWYGAPEGGIDPDGLAACAELAEGIGGLSRERVGAEMLKLMAADDPAPAVASMAMSGVLMRVLPGGASDPLSVLVHVEEEAGLDPDPIRRLALVGGDEVAERLRLSRAQAGALQALRDAQEAGWGPGELGYRLGRARALDVLALNAALSGREIDPVSRETALVGAAAALPVKAADLMPDFSGPALGEKLREIEARWIASGFTLERAELLS